MPLFVRRFSCKLPLTSALRAVAKLAIKLQCLSSIVIADHHSQIDWCIITIMLFEFMLTQQVAYKTYKTPGLLLSEGLVCMQGQTISQPSQSSVLSELHNGVLEHLILWEPKKRKWTSGQPFTRPRRGAKLRIWGNSLHAKYAYATCLQHTVPIVPMHSQVLVAPFKNCCQKHSNNQVPEQSILVKKQTLCHTLSLKGF